MKFRKISSIGVAAGLLITGVALALPASADPVSPGYAAVGSDTLQDSMNALTNGTTVTGSSVRVGAAGNFLGNFDAFGSANIQTKAGAAFIVRPSGSGAGIDALRLSISSGSGLVDIARSSSGPGTNANANGILLYVPYARDAVAYAYNGDAAALGNLTKAQLTQIYSANTPTTINGVVVKPRLPQSASGADTSRSP